MIDFKDGTTSIVEGFNLTDAVKRLDANEEHNIVTIKRMGRRTLEILSSANPA